MSETRFVHIAKKVSAICAWNFCRVFSATGNFRPCFGKDLSTGWARTFDLQITNQILFHCAAASFFKSFCGIYYETFRPFLYLLAAGFSGRICFFWPGFSGRFWCYWPRDFPAVSVVACWDFPALTFPAWQCKKSPSRVRRPGFSGRICSYWPGFSGRSFSGMGNFKKLYGRQANSSGIDSGIFCPYYRNFLVGS